MADFEFIEFNLKKECTWPRIKELLLVLLKNGNIRKGFFEEVNWKGNLSKEIIELRPDPDDEFRVKEFKTGKTFHVPYKIKRHHFSLVVIPDEIKMTIGVYNFNEKETMCDEVLMWCYYPGRNNNG